MHVGIAYPWWRGKRSRHSRRMRTRNLTYLARGPWHFRTICVEHLLIQDFLCYHARIWLNTLRPRQNGRHFPDDIFKCILFNENVWISLKISLKFAPQGPINNIPALVQIMAWRRPDDKPLSGPMMVKSPTHICVTRPQWVNALNFPILASALACEWIPTHFLPFKVWRFSQRWYNITAASHGNPGVTNNRQSIWFSFFKNKLWLSWKKTLKLRNRMWSLGVFYYLSPNKPLNQEFVARWTYNLPETSASMTLIWRHRNSIL